VNESGVLPASVLLRGAVTCQVVEAVEFGLDVPGMMCNSF